MAEFERVPVVNVNVKNVNFLYPSIVLAIKNSTFISIDLELSGIGNRREINCSSIEDRYKALSEVAKTRAIISFGISCFKLQSNCPNSKNCLGIRFLVQTYNVVVLCNENYIVEPNSLQFLIQHGFDFNYQYEFGLPYHRGNDKDESSIDTPSLRNLLNEIVIAKHPIILHNGLVDIIFLYQNLYCELPSSFPSFLADLSELFSSGIYDTKYISEFQARLPASYLQYIFRKKQRENANKMKNEKHYIAIEFVSYKDLSDIEHLRCHLREVPEKKNSVTVCKNYANHGWCSKGKDCTDSHNVDDVLDKQGCGLPSKKRKIEDIKEQEISTSKISVDNSLSHTGHRAGFDAFMTGFVFASFLEAHCKLKSPSGLTAMLESGFDKTVNKIYLIGKNVPLIVTKGNFAKSSSEHKKNYRN
ncbi:target of EGR1 protein 1-like isoform X1 [Centruroides vittatus]|uniref:target of EGR1 protein 1-like isoform X1 n=1 Tax=Centruroides vittatus TaxID=120091 RepID=UPI0035102DFC